MIHEEICTYEVCKLAKEKGFDEHPPMYFHSGVKSNLREVGSNGANPNNIPYSPHISCPTQTQLQRWLREKKKIEVYVRNYEKTTNFPHHYWNLITDGNGKTLKIGNKMFDTYELALEDALKYALENLV